MTWRLLVGHAQDRLGDFPDASAQTCVTSPPYWGLRDYGVTGQVGLESTPEAYVFALVAVFREVRRVLKDDGTVWLNLGDSYAATTKGSGGHTPKQDSNAGSFFTDRAWAIPDGLKPKDLVGIPWMVAFALRADGWYLRSDIIWSKPNPMPESVTDRPTKAHEYLFLLAKSQRYYYDAEAIAEHAVEFHKTPNRPRVDPFTRKGLTDALIDGVSQCGVTETRNKRSVWTVPTQPYPDAHFATYPERLIEPCILAGSREEDTVLDPFTGSGTTGAVAIRYQRNFIGCELNPTYVALARTRIGDVAPLLAQEVA